VDPRAEVYFGLSECFKEPTLGLARDVASGLLRDVLSQAFAELGLILEADGLREVGTEEEVLDRLCRAYHALFTVPSSRFVLPVESVFKEWRAGEGLAAASGMIMGPPALDMLERYRIRGLEIPAEMKDYPDHLALLLEYGGLLCQDGDLQEHRKFLASHLDSWIETLASQVEERSEVPFYGVVARALGAFVRAERRDFGLAEAP
jgi:TorA maturation chaperone TorD